MRAWDAADEYVLDHLVSDEVTAPSADGAWLLVNDSFGALAVGLFDCSPQWLSDSHVSLLGTQENLERSDLDAEQLTWLSSFDEPAGPLDAVIIKVPKTLSLLEDQLHRIRPYLGPDTLVVGAGMTKNIHSSTLELFESIVGPTTTSLARKKARLIFATVDPDLPVDASPHPVKYGTPMGLNTVNHAGIFSQAKLDIGTRFLLEELPTLEIGYPKTVVDLGCGNGLVGAFAGKHFPSAHVTFADESHRAVASARETWAANHPDREATFLVADVLEGVANASVDLVLLNPPFHDQHAISDAVALRMFDQSRRVLREDGRLVVIANRNLGYHTTLQRLFHTSSTVTGNKKFVLLVAQR